MEILTQASHEWATRPSDQRFTSLIELDAFCKASRASSVARVVSTRKLECAPVAGDNRALVVAGPSGHSATLSNWAFGQLAARVAAPAGYMRTLPGALAADCINYGLHKTPADEVGVLLNRDGSSVAVRAVTGPNYGRIWNCDITGALVRQFGNGLDGHFRVPGEFGEKVIVSKHNTTLFASDRDMFVFLADEENRITVPNRRDGKSGEMARGFFVWNSEVGAATLGVATFLFDYVCKNRIVWGSTQYREIKVKHTAGAPDRFIDEVRPAIERMSNSSTHDVVKAITDARAARVDDIDAFLANRKFTKSEMAGIKAAHLADEGRPMENLWDVATGVTAYARDAEYQDVRVSLERKAGLILDMA